MVQAIKILDRRADTMFKCQSQTTERATIGPVKTLLRLLLSRDAGITFLRSQHENKASSKEKRLKLKFQKEA